MTASVQLIGALGGGWDVSQLPTPVQVFQKLGKGDYKLQSSFTCSFGEYKAENFPSLLPYKTRQTLHGISCHALVRVSAG